MSDLRGLWAGDLPLDRAFWTYAVFGGLAVNLITTALFLALLAIGMPLAAVAIGYGVAVPYNVISTVGVWRSADRHDADRTRANTMRIVTLIGMVLLSVT